MDLAEKHRPASLDDVAGNAEAVKQLKAWAGGWPGGRRAALLHGPPGCGKTSAALALAREMGWETVEMNASDARTQERIETVALSAARQQSLFGGRKLILMDEADALHGTHDRGGYAALGRLLKETGHPVVLTANDLYAIPVSVRNLCQAIPLRSLTEGTVLSVLKRVAAEEGLRVSEEDLQAVARNARGDLRSALNDLQAWSGAPKPVLAPRDRSVEVFEALAALFKRSGPEALETLRRLDMDPEELLPWVEESLPLERSGDGLARALRVVQRCDLFLGRAARGQNYRLWGYATNLLAFGLPASGPGSKPSVRYPRPNLYWLFGGRSADAVAARVGRALGVPKARARGAIPVLRRLAERGADLSALGLEERQIDWLRGKK